MLCSPKGMLLLRAGAVLNAHRQGFMDSCTPLHLACDLNAIFAVRALLHSGADLNAVVS